MYSHEVDKRRTEQVSQVNKGQCQGFHSSSVSSSMSHEASHCCRGAVRSSTRRCKAATARLWTSAAAMPTLHAAALALALIGVQQVAAQSYCASSDCGTQQKPKIPDTTFYCGNGASGTVPAASSPSTDDVDYCADSSACPCGRCCFCECEVAAGWTSAGGWSRRFASVISTTLCPLHRMESTWRHITRTPPGWFPVLEVE